MKHIAASLMIGMAIAGCTAPERKAVQAIAEGKTDSRGEVALRVPSAQLQSNGCPYPDDIKITDNQGHPLTVKAVERIHGECRVKVQS